MQRLEAVIGAAACLCAAAVAPAHAQPERETRRSAQAAFMVVNVRSDDVLNIRSGPSTAFGVIGELPPDSRGITITGDCRSVWCPVQHQSTSGWVNRRFLADEELSSARQRRTPSPRLAALDPTPPDLALRQRPGTETATSLPKAAFLFFVAQGWAEHQAAGIVGNLQTECGQLLNCSRSSGGLAQWRADRVTRFREVFGYSLERASFEDQLSYIQWELTHPMSPRKESGRILRGAKDAASAASLFDFHYESSAGDTRGSRITNARAILRKYGTRSDY
jgi:hypothetical protein